MTLFGFGRVIFMAAAACATLALPARAATITEGSFPGGDFSSAFASPTAIVNGYDVVTGSMGAGDYDFLHFTDMMPGAQTVTVNVTGPTGIGMYISRGTLRYSTTPFASRNAGTNVGSFLLSPIFGTSQSFTFSLGPTFSGSLYLSLNVTMGPVMRYSVSVPGNIDLPGVPLPADRKSVV